ncbi:hypothetical protein [Nitrosopumilus sp.]|uniref:hypothetical protein n=1 Tax=Nitrosopumilus sp. TaxID=2024843 RepID=UPI0034A03909
MEASNYLSSNMPNAGHVLLEVAIPTISFSTFLGTYVTVKTGKKKFNLVVPGKNFKIS